VQNEKRVIGNVYEKRHGAQEASTKDGTLGWRQQEAQDVALVECRSGIWRTCHPPGEVWEMLTLPIPVSGSDRIIPCSSTIKEVGWGYMQTGDPAIQIPVQWNGRSWVPAPAELVERDFVEQRSQWADGGMQMPVDVREAYNRAAHSVNKAGIQEKINLLLAKKVK
jgi:hypothetical protein